MLFDREQVQTKQELVALIFELLDHNDAVPWKNDSAYSLLQALATWLDERPDSEAASWQLFADALQSAAAPQ